MTTAGGRIRSGRTWALVALLLLAACGGSPRKRMGVDEGLWDPNPAHRTEAVNQLQQTRDPAQVPRLIEMLDDPDAGVRLSANAALEDITGRRTNYRPWMNEAERRQAVLDWRAWWAARSKGGA